MRRRTWVATWRAPPPAARARLATTATGQLQRAGASVGCQYRPRGGGDTGPPAAPATIGCASRHCESAPPPRNSAAGREGRAEFLGRRIRAPDGVAGEAWPGWVGGLVSLEQPRGQQYHPPHVTTGAAARGIVVPARAGDTSARSGSRRFPGGGQTVVRFRLPLVLSPLHHPSARLVCHGERDCLTLGAKKNSQQTATSRHGSGMRGARVR